VATEIEPSRLLADRAAAFQQKLNAAKKSELVTANKTHWLPPRTRALNCGRITARK